MYPTTADIDIIDELDSATRLLEQALDRLEHWLAPQPNAPSGAAEQTGARDQTTGRPAAHRPLARISHRRSLRGRRDAAVTGGTDRKTAKA